MEQFLFSFFQYWYWCIIRLYLISNLIGSLSFTNFLHFWKKSKKSKNPSFFLSFVNNRLSISQEKLLEKTNSYLFCSYNVIFSLLKQLRLIIEHGKTKVFYFSRLHKVFNFPFLNLSCFGGLILHSKYTWYYLGFIFDRKLSFRQHIKFYLNKALSTIKYIKILGNFTHSLLLHQKHLLYRTYILLIALYRFPL